MKILQRDFFFFAYNFLTLCHSMFCKKMYLIVFKKNKEKIT
jgi:hypothetical protein